MKRFFLQHCLIIAMLLLAGCVAVPAARTKMTAGHCDPPIPYRYDAAFAPKISLGISPTSELLARYPSRNLMTANALGILPALEKFVSLSTAEGRESDIVQN